MSKSKEEIFAELIRSKQAADLRPDQAREVALAQLAHDEALAAAEAPAKPAGKSDKK